MDKRTNYYIQNTIQKIKDRAKRTPPQRGRTIPAPLVAPACFKPRDKSRMRKVPDCDYEKMNNNSG